jgi:TRAP-type mannitol/chloroaromatic compound transport system substrate-binding protein
MNRRKFLTTAAVGGTAAAAASTFPAPAIAQGRIKLTMVTSWGRGLAGVFDAAQRTADTINAMADGSMEVEIKAAGELVGAFEVFDAVSSGQADIYHSADYYFLGQHPGFAFYTAVPFGMTAQELNNWYYHMGGRELQDELTELFNLKTFQAGNTGVQGGGWFNKEITGPEDFNGLKFRMPGLGGKALGHLGASVQNIPGAEVYQALASGAIDGTEWIGPWADEKAGFYEITKIYYTAGFHEPGSALSLAVNRDVYNGLTATQQKIIEAAAGETHVWNLAQYLANNGAALQRLIAAGVQIKEFPDSVWDAFGGAAQKVFDENMSDPLFKKIYDSFRDSLAKSAGWIATSESAYTSQRNRVLGI